MYVDDIIVTIPFCHEKFVSIDLDCKRGKQKKTIKSPAESFLDLQNASMRFKQIFEYESKFFVNKSGKGQKKMFQVQAYGWKMGAKKRISLGSISVDISTYLGKKDYNVGLELKKPYLKSSMIQFNITLG